MTRRRVLLSWSSGKDSAWTLQTLRQDPEVELCGLFTTIDDAGQQVAMHGTPIDLVQAQAEALHLPLTRIGLPWPCPNADYEARMSEFFERAAAQGIDALAFGDLQLADVRAYRERQFEASPLTPLFPLWGRDTTALAREMVAAGLRAIVTCVDSRQLDAGFAGRRYDADFLAELPAGVDPCGENGEFHSFVYAGPMFARPLAVRAGKSRREDGFVYTELFPGLRPG